MLCLAIAQPFLQLTSRSAAPTAAPGDAWTPLVAAFVGNWLFRVPFAFSPARRGSGLVAVWAVLILDHVARAALAADQLRRGKWRTPRRRR
jgi:Na+-driven multidrug efflux pump